ncbi:MAG: DUF2268 domain-containing putative Zn-dependent protease [Bacteroidia bacterium]
MRNIISIGLLLLATNCIGQLVKSDTKIHTEDIVNYWIAYDSILATHDETMQIKYMQTLYIDKASEGLKDFISARNFTAKEWVSIINIAPKFWNSIRPKTLSIVKQTNEINRLMTRFKQLYPSFKQPEIYFTIGCLRSGGTTAPDKILIGAEIATADSTVDASEISSWLQGVFKLNTGILQLVAHEAGHTQQKETSENTLLLGNCIYEGSCDFIAELLLEYPYSSPYLTYGKNNEKRVFKKFEKSANEKDFSEWLSNGGNAPTGQADLGYYIGYEICKCYYENAKNKADAFLKILTIDYTDNNAVNKFYEETGYKEKFKN